MLQSSMISHKLQPWLTFYHFWSQNIIKNPVRAHQTLRFALFCVLIAEISKKMGTKRAYKVSMMGGAFFLGHLV